MTNEQVVVNGKIMVKVQEAKSKQGALDKLQRLRY